MFVFFLLLSLLLGSLQILNVLDISWFLLIKILIILINFNKLDNIDFNTITKFLFFNKINSNISYSKPRSLLRTSSSGLILLSILAIIIVCFLFILLIIFKLFFINQEVLLNVCSINLHYHTLRRFQIS